MHGNDGWDPEDGAHGFAVIKLHHHFSHEGTACFFPSVLPTLGLRVIEFPLELADLIHEGERRIVLGGAHVLTRAKGDGLLVVKEAEVDSEVATRALFGGQFDGCFWWKGVAGGEAVAAIDDGQAGNVGATDGAVLEADFGIPWKAAEGAAEVFDEVLTHHGALLGGGEVTTEFHRAFGDAEDAGHQKAEDAHGDDHFHEREGAAMEAGR